MLLEHTDLLRPEVRVLERQRRDARGCVLRRAALARTGAFAFTASARERVSVVGVAAAAGNADEPAEGGDLLVDKPLDGMLRADAALGVRRTQTSSSG